MSEVRQEGNYYNRLWRGYVEVAAVGGEWVRAHEKPLGSVEQGLDLVAKTRVTGLVWRIVDVGGNVYDSGKFDEKIVFAEFKTDPIPPEIAMRQQHFYEKTLYTTLFAKAVRQQADETRSLVDDSVHIRRSDRRRLLEDALKEKEDGAA